MSKTLKNLLKFFSVLPFLFFTHVLTANEPSSIQISELFVDLTHPKVLYAHNAKTSLIPASVSKLFVAAGALQQWGSPHTFATNIYSRGQIKNGELKGDLVFYSLGDPEFTNETMWELTNNLRLKGIQKVTGNIIVNASYLGPIPVEGADRIAAQSTSKNAYDSLLSSAGSNFGGVGLAIYPGEKPGDLARTKLLPYDLPNIILNGAVRTQSGAGNALQLQRISQNQKEILNVSGTIGINSNPIILYRSVGNPAITTGNLLLAFLHHVGIKVTGKILVEFTPVKKTDQLLTSVQSKPLIQCLQDMLRYSNNYIADILTLDLWRENQHNPFSSLKLSDAAKILLNNEHRFLSQSKLFNLSQENLPALASGSGLTPSNRISAEHLIALLNGMYQNKRDFPSFYGSLVIPGQSNTWHNLPTSHYPWMDVVAIKTGYLTAPKIVYSIAGYFRLQNNDIGAFAVLLNSTPQAQNRQLFQRLIQHLNRVKPIDINY